MYLVLHVVKRETELKQFEDRAIKSKKNREENEGIREKEERGRGRQREH